VSNQGTLQTVEVSPAGWEALLTCGGVPPTPGARRS
jgi:hypothetical protein